MKLFCPSCGSPLEFRYDDSFVRVCPACRSAIARTDRGIDTLGQLADLAPSRSGLSLGANGRYQGRSFVLAGRAEYAHPAGGSWEEWFVKFDDGRWGWLSHAEGRWALTFRMPEGHDLPAIEAIALGARLALAAGIELTVGEINTASEAGAEGELPFSLDPASRSRFVDASDDKGRFATIDYGPQEAHEAPVLYLGRLVEPAALGLDVAAAAAARDADPTQAAVGSGERLACPNCGGSIELRVPGRSLCVSCAYCNSLLDCEGPLAILAKQGELDAGRPSIALGAVGRFEGVEYTVTGRLRRQVSFEGGFFEWDEYLLYAPAAGYRWLVSSRGHYSFVTPLPPGAVVETGGGGARYRGVEFKRFDRGRAEVTGVWGEFYWRVVPGESVETIDFIAPPAMLSRESSESELHWSLGVYMSSEAVRDALSLAAPLEPPRDVAANQPFAHARWSSMAVVLLALLLVSVLARMLSASSQQVYVGQFRLFDAAAGASPPASVAQGASYVIFTPPFELSGDDNIEVSLSLPLENDWAFAVVDLVHEESGELRSYEAELEYYSGVDGGERWSEGSTESSHLFSAGRAGSHVLRLEVQTPAPPSLSIAVSVAQNVFAVGQLGWLLMLLALPTALLCLVHGTFERWRWSESDFDPDQPGVEPQ